MSRIGPYMRRKLVDMQVASGKRPPYWQPPIEILPMVAQNVFNNDDAMQALQRLWDDIGFHDPDPSTLRLPPFWYLNPEGPEA